MVRSLSLAIAFACAALLPSAAFAGPDEDVRDAAWSEAARLRAQGWPRQKCLMGIRFYNTTVYQGNGTILAGDKLLKIGATPVATATTDQVAQAIGSIAPNEKVAVDVSRGGRTVSLDLPCGNTADLDVPYLQALDFAAKKKWTECIDALASRPEDPDFLTLRAKCAMVSRKSKDYPFQSWADMAARNTFAVGNFVPESRLELAKALLKSRFDLSLSAYRELVSTVRAWDNGKTWDSIQPDYSAFRRATERSVKNSLIDPQSAIIEMPYDFIWGSWRPAFTGNKFVGYMTCGTVNAKNRMGGYTGATSFIAVVDEAGIVEFTDMDSGSLTYYRPIDTSCAELVKRLEYVGSQSDTLQGGGSQQQPLSVSQELANLAKLHAEGALTDQEYAAAKARVLSGSK